MSKPNGKRARLSAIRASYVEAVGGERVEIEDAAGNVYTFPQPLFADDDWSKRVNDAQGEEATARAILGDEQYERYREAGNADLDITLAFADEVARMREVQANRRPTPSSTS